MPTPSQFNQEHHNVQSYVENSHTSDLGKGSLVKDRHDMMNSANLAEAAQNFAYQAWRNGVEFENYWLF